MMPGFGFSVGDFVAAIELTVRIKKALRETGGATTECRLLIQDLQSLEQILEVLQALRPMNGSLSHVNAIRGMALTCLDPLREFASKIDKSYSLNFGIGPSRNSFVRGAKKVQWAVFATEEVVKFRAVIAAKVASISLLLGIFNSEALTRIEAQNQESRHSLLDNSTAMRNSLERSLAQLTIAQQELRGDVSKLDGDTQAQQAVLVGKIDAQTSSLNELARRLDQIHNHAHSNVRDIVGLCFGIKSCNERMLRMTRHGMQRTQSLLFSTTKLQQEHRLETSKGFWTVVSQLDILRTTGSSLLGNLLPFSEKVLGYLKKNVKANIEIYKLLLNIQANLPQAIFTSRQDSIHFEDVLGRSKQLPYQYFRHWDVFESMLRCEFKGLPGEQKVLHGDYILMDSVLQGVPIQKGAWHQLVYPGSQLKMSAIMKALRAKKGLCPRPQCLGQADLIRTKDVVHCKNCDLAFIQESFEGAWQRQTLQKSRTGKEADQYVDSNPSLRDYNRERGVEQGQRWEQEIRSLEIEEQELRVFRMVHLLESDPPPPPLPPPRRLPIRNWNCGYCGEGLMSIRFDTHCTACSHPRDHYSTAY